MAFQRSLGREHPNIILGRGVRGAEVGGIRWQRFDRSGRLHPERREGLACYGGRSAFACSRKQAFITVHFHRVYLDGYIQAGVVGMRNRDCSSTAALRCRGRSGAIFGRGRRVGCGPAGLYRLDVGPADHNAGAARNQVHGRLSQRLIGNAAPPSGPAVTLAADF